jgi:hypothetical protein
VKKPPELPNIEDATLRACLAPLVDAMNRGAEAAAMPNPVGVRHVSAPPHGPPVGLPAGLPAGLPVGPVAGPSPRPAGSNDNPTPRSDPIGVAETEPAAVPKTLAEWRSLADEDFGAFRMIGLFLGMTDAELETAATEFPKQIGGTMERISGLKRRLADRYDSVTTVAALLERAMARAADKGGTDRPPSEVISVID